MPTDYGGEAAPEAIRIRYPRLMIWDRLKAPVVGAGYVGAGTALGLAEQGRDIVPVGQNPHRLSALADDRIRSASRGCPRRTRPSTPSGGLCRVRRSPGIGWTSP